MSDDRRFLEARLNLCSMDEWRELVDELDSLAESIDSVASIDNEKDLFYIRGQLSVLSMLINMEETTRMALEQLDLEPTE